VSKFAKFIDSAIERGIESAKPFDLKAMATLDAPVGSLVDCLDALAIDCAGQMEMEVSAVASLLDKHSADLVPVEGIDGETIGYMNSDFAT